MVELSIRLTFPMQTDKLLNGVGSLSSPTFFSIYFMLNGFYFENFASEGQELTI